MRYNQVTLQHLTALAHLQTKSLQSVYEIFDWIYSSIGDFKYGFDKRVVTSFKMADKHSDDIFEVELRNIDIDGWHFYKEKLSDMS